MIGNKGSESRRAFPYVSVIITCYNQDRWLGSALESVLTQNHPNLEILVVDDASTDNTQHVVAGFPQVKYIRHSQSNGGPAAARNTGLENSNGGLVAFLDGDDLWLAGKLHAQVKYLEANPEISLVYTPVLVLDKSQNITTWPRMFSGRLTFGRLLISNPIVPSSVMVRRSCFEKVGLFDTNLKGTDDWEMWLRITSLFRVARLKKPFAIFRDHGAGLHTDYDSHFKYQVEAINKVREFTEKHALGIPSRIFDQAVAVRYIQMGLNWLETGNVPRFESLFPEGMKRAHGVPVRIWLRILALSLRHSRLGATAARAIWHQVTG